MRVEERCAEHFKPPEKRPERIFKPEGCGNCSSCIENSNNRYCPGYTPIRRTYDENHPEIFLG